MHPSAYAHMKMCIETYLKPDRHYRILDLGSRRVARDHLTHRNLLTNYDVEYVGADVAAGPNVDVVMKKPYRIPVKSNSFDVVLTSQAFEHIAFPWASFLEMSRIVKPGGFIFLTSPSRGHKHGSPDCWRYYPDSTRALAAFARMNLRETFTDMPPTLPGKGRLDYAAIDTVNAYWGDTVGVFQKPNPYSKLVVVAREVIIWWANRVGGVDHIKPPAPRKSRQKILG
jgi:SAM-dependent methyltransferase